MVDRMIPASEADEEPRAYLEEELDAEALAAFDAVRELWESGELPRMIDEGGFSGLPPSVRPR
ncbi:MAG TPA: hypothetical protein VKA37_11255 [Halobacteriales archaeon]|nr:hypothetical protein [Halobacteriales archaeon]